MISFKQVHESSFEEIGMMLTSPSNSEADRAELVSILLAYRVNVPYLREALSRYLYNPTRNH